MSRTDNTLPVRLQDQRARDRWHYGGVWRGIKAVRRRYNRRARRQARAALHRERDPAPDQPRGRARWDMY